jgi:phage baseplate assembly protein W
MALYKGFSTISGTANFRLTDFDLVKQDLLNHFNIRKGEKLMNPDYGTVIWDLIFEPFNDATKLAIETDIKKIVASDPRIAVQSAVITQYDLGVQIELDLIFVQTNQIDKLLLQFNQNTNAITRL